MFVGIISLLPVAASVGMPAAFHSRANHEFLLQGILIAIDMSAEAAFNSLDEVAAVERCLEADDAAAEQSFEEVLPPRADFELLPVRKRDVPERDDPAVRQPLAHELRRQREMVVLHEYQR